MTATDKLLEMLRDDWQPATEIEAKCKAAGYSVDQIRRAREGLGVTRLEGGVSLRSGAWHWRRPPSGCPTCGRSWHSDAWRARDYWADRPSPPVSTGDEDDIALNDEPSAPSSPLVRPARLEPYGPPTCTVCGKISAQDRGRPCPWWNGAQRCPGVVE